MPGFVCSAGACGCPLSELKCGNLCTNVQLDPLNCGTCGKVCGLGQLCLAGKCTP
jgi:hypothetical protein